MDSAYTIATEMDSKKGAEMDASTQTDNVLLAILQATDSQKCASEEELEVMVAEFEDFATNFKQRLKESVNSPESVPAIIQDLLTYLLAIAEKDSKMAELVFGQLVVGHDDIFEEFRMRMARKRLLEHTLQLAQETLQVFEDVEEAFKV